MADEVSPEVMQELADHHRRFLAFLEPRAGSLAAAEELLQAAYVKGLERGGGIRVGERAVAWFYRLLRHALIDFYRHRNAERRALEQQMMETATTAEADAALEDAVCQCVHGLIPILKGEYAEILRRVEMDGLGVAAAAERPGISPGTAGIRLHRARQALRKRLELSCGTCTEHGCLDCTCGTKGPADVRSGVMPRRVIRLHGRKETPDNDG